MTPLPIDMALDDDNLALALDDDMALDHTADAIVLSDAAAIVMALDDLTAANAMSHDDSASIVIVIKMLSPSPWP
jgi:hypothetical protein